MLVPLFDAFLYFEKKKNPEKKKERKKDRKKETKIRPMFVLHVTLLITFKHILL